MFIDKDIDFIKGQIEHHKRSIEHFHSKRDPGKISRHRTILQRFEDILPKMEEARLMYSGATPPPSKDIVDGKVGSRLGNLSDLPQELRAQLVSAQIDELEQAVIDVVNDDYAGVATIDEILVALYRKTNNVYKRDALATKIYRMTRKGSLISVPGKKGVYALAEMAGVFPPIEGSEENGDDVE